MWALAADISEGIQYLKKSRSNDKRAAYSAFKTVAFGNKVSEHRAKRSLSRIVGIGRRVVGKAVKDCGEIMSGERRSWLYFERKTRSDAVSDEDRQLVSTYWVYETSRPTGDKKEIIKKQTGKHQYISHVKHVLEKTQTEAFLELAAQYPGVKIKQRKFEILKPFFVHAASERDRRSSLCRNHVDVQVIFKDCMKFRKETLKKTKREAIVPQNLTEVANITMCPKENSRNEYHNLKCLTRYSDQCGVDKLKLLPEEISALGKATWKRYMYLGTGRFLSNGQEKKKLSLVTETTPPNKLLEYFLRLLEEYPYHSLMARWQREQIDNIIEHLPLNEVVCVHDYSQGYSCRQQDEPQSEYFDVAKVSLHITILYRHAIQTVDGMTSTEADPKVIKEHPFVISDDDVQDYHSAHKVQELLKAYLTDQLKIKIYKLHEFTNGCAAQYKSRHCIGDLSSCFADFGFQINRNYFETSHAKGEQDAAGSNVKQKVSHAVLKKAAIIRNAKDMVNYQNENFKYPAVTTYDSWKSHGTSTVSLLLCTSKG